MFLINVIIPIFFPYYLPFLCSCSSSPSHLVDTHTRDTTLWTRFIDNCQFIYEILSLSLSETLTILITTICVQEKNKNSVLYLNLYFNFCKADKRSFLAFEIRNLRK